MNTNKLLRFRDSAEFFACPVCNAELRLWEHSLRCAGGHCYDIAKYGYVNLLLHTKREKNYSKDSFLKRKQILENGYYSHILKELLAVLEDYDTGSVLLDAGCGEGYYASEVSKHTAKTILAFDIVKDSVQLAAQRDSGNLVRWFVGDLAKIPLRRQCVDSILNIFSPANYAEFDRVLKPGGYLIKVIPGENHVKELRAAAKDALVNKEYSNEQIAGYFEQHYPLLEKRKCSATYQMPQEHLEAFVEMTPLLFHVDKEHIDREQIKEVTVEAEILLGRR